MDTQEKTAVTGEGNVPREGFKVTVTDLDGVILDVIDITDYDVSKPLARADIMNQIQKAIGQ